LPNRKGKLNKSSIPTESISSNLAKKIKQLSTTVMDAEPLKALPEDIEQFLDLATWHS